jgi:NodT family efflux transporter outer membrane factor (OMF) lipoprotein
LNVGVSWEADLWGSIRRSVEAASTNAQASIADIEAAKLSAQAELAQDYFLLRIADARKALLDDTVAAYQKSLQLTQNQYNVGVAARADVVTADTQLKSAKAQAVDVGVQRAQLEHAIAILIGKAPAEFSIAPLTSKFALLPPPIPVGVPSQLLERRPDIAAAERRAASANAKIGVAEAAFYPDLTLSGELGFQSSSFAKWLTLPSRFWTLGPALAQSIFDGGLRKAQSAQAVAVYDQSVATYRQTILGGFQEVEDNLAALRILEQEAALQDDAVKAARESVQITTNQYKAGIVDFLNVVNVETIALDNERTALTIQSNRLSAAVSLIKAVGGGWNASDLNTDKDQAAK